jgi:hypothetical protein
MLSPLTVGCPVLWLFFGHPDEEQEAPVGHKANGSITSSVRFGGCGEVDELGKGHCIAAVPLGVKWFLTDVEPVKSVVKVSQNTQRSAETVPTLTGELWPQSRSTWRDL